MTLHASPNIVNDNSTAIEVSLSSPPYQAAPALPPLETGASCAGLSPELDFYARHGAALFPLPAGSKAPGKADFWPSPADATRPGSFKHEYSRDPLQWLKWWHEHPGCNFGVVAFASGKKGWITLDIDVKPEPGQSDEAARQEAWDSWDELCKSWGFAETIAPHVNSARDGWHCHFALRPGDPDAETLRQPDAIRNRINVRVIGYTVAAGSFYDGTAKGEKSGLYRFMPNAPAPHDAPQALIDHCMPPKPREASDKVGKLDFEHCKKLYQWLGDNRAITTDEEWRGAGMAARLEFGDQGRELWEILAQKLFNEPVDAKNDGRWRSFATEPTGNETTMGSIFKLAREAGWKGNVRSSKPMLPAEIAQSIGAGMATAAPAASANLGPPMQMSLKPLRVISAASFAGKPPPVREELVTGLIPAKIVGGLYADGGTGKSLLALMLGTAISSGTLWLNRIVQHGPVVYVCAEDDEEEVHRRLADICRETGVDMAALRDFHILPLADEESVLAMADGRSSVLHATPLYRQLAELSADVKPKLLIGDTLSDIFAGAENDRMQAKQFVKIMRHLVVPHGGTGLVLAHPSVDGMRSGSGSAGSTGWNNSFRWRGYLERVLEEDGKEPDQSRRVLRTKKANYGANGGEIEMRWQNGCFQVVGSETVAMMDPLWREKRADRCFLDLLRWHLKNNNPTSLANKAGNYAPRLFKKEAAVQGVTFMELEAAMTRLLNSGQIENAPYGPPSKRAYSLYTPPLPPLNT